MKPFSPIFSFNSNGIKQDEISGEFMIITQNHFLKFLKTKNIEIPHIIVLLQCTSPYRDNNDIELAIKKLIKGNLEISDEIIKSEKSVSSFNNGIIKKYWPLIDNFTDIYNKEKLVKEKEEAKKNRAKKAGKVKKRGPKKLGRPRKKPTKTSTAPEDPTANLNPENTPVSTVTLQ